MSQTPPPPEDFSRLNALIDRGGHLSHWLISQIVGLLAPQPGTRLGVRYLRWLMRHYLLPAEAVLRRAVHLIAATLPPQVQGQPKQSCHPRAGRGPAQTRVAKARAPLFRLTEPHPHPYTNYIPVNQRPRVSVPGLTPRAPEPAAKDMAAQLEARLRRRLAALQAAWDDPDKAALRLQRLRARGGVKSPALSFLRIPGARANTLDETAAPILQELNTAAFEISVAARLAATDTS